MTSSDLPPDLTPADGPPDQGSLSDGPPDTTPQLADTPPDTTPQSGRLARLKAAASAVYDATPMGLINSRAVHPALMATKRFIENRLPNEQTIAPDFQSDNPIMHGIGYAKAATAAAGNAALSQVPESSLGIGGAIGTGKAIGAVVKYGPELVGRVFPKLGALLATDVGTPVLAWLRGKFAGDLPPDPTRAAPAATPAPAPENAPPAATAQPAPAAPADLPTIQPGSKTGDAHALFAYNDTMTPDGEPRSIYNVFGDPEHPAVKNVGFGSSVTKARIDEAGIPVVGREPRAAQNGWEPLDLNPPQGTSFYHGSGSTGLTRELVNPEMTKIDNLFGQGIYLTDNPEVARGYARARSRTTKTPVVYKAELGNARLLDLEKPAPPQIATIFKDQARKLSPLDPSGDVSAAVEKAASAEGATGEQIFRAFSNAISDLSHREEIPVGEFFDDFMDLSDRMRQAGYDGYTHTGGQRTGRAPHRVAVLLDRSKLSGFAPVAEASPATAGVGAPPEAQPIAPAVPEETAQLMKHGYGGPPPEAPPAEPPPTGPLYPPSDFEPESPPSKFGEFQRLMVDRFQPIKYAKGQEIAPRFANAGGNYTDAYTKARTLTGRTMADLTDLMKQKNELYKPLRNAQDMSAFNELYSLKNHQDLARAGRMTTGVTEEGAQQMIDNLKARLGPENFKRIDDTVENVATWNNDNGLRILQDAGKITPEAAERWRKNFPHYMPSEVLDDELMHGGQPSALGKIKQNFMKHKAGTDQRINENADQMISRGLLDKVSGTKKQEVIDAVANNFGKTIGQEIYRDGSVIKTYKPDSQVPEGYVESSVRTSDGRIVAVSKQVESMLQGLNKFQADVATQAISHYNALFREGATAMRVSFSAGHFIRAAESALMNTRPVEGAANPLSTLAQSVVSTAKDMIGMTDADMQAFRRAGGAFGGMADAKSVPLPFRLQSIGQKAATVAAIPFKIPARLGRFSDQVIRLNEFKRLAPTKMPEMLKALNARDVSIDFEKSGDLLKHINQWVPFINDKMQANVNTLRMFRDNPAIASGRVAAYIVAPTMGLYYWNRKFANDDMVDPYIRENYFYMNTGKTTMNNGKEVPVVFTIPKKGIYQYLSNATTAMLDSKFNRPQFQQDAKSYGPKNQAREIAAEVTPPPAKLLIEPVMNQSLYTGRPIVPQSQQFVDPHLQANTASSNTSRVIANKTGVPAQIVENMANNIFPAAHQFMGLTDKGLAAAGVRPENPQPPNATLQKTQALQPFLRPASGMYSTEEANQADILQKLKTAVGTPKFMAKQALRQYVQNATPESLAQVDKWMGQLNGEDRKKVIASVYTNERLQQMSPTDRAMARTPGKYRGKVWQGLSQ